MQQSYLKPDFEKIAHRRGKVALQKKDKAALSHITGKRPPRSLASAADDVGENGTGKRADR